MFLRIDLDTLSVDDARDVLQKLIDRLQELNRESEIPSPQAWKKAKEQIEGGSQTYESEKS